MRACLSRRGFMGLSALILLIAVILVSTVAAGVYLSTASSLQNRALMTGSAARDQVSTGVEVIGVHAMVDVDTEMIYGYELRLRMLPGSNAINPQHMTMLYRHANARFDASWQHTSMSSFASTQHVVDTTTAIDGANVGTSIPLTLPLSSPQQDAALLTTQDTQGADEAALLFFRSAALFNGAVWDLSDASEHLYFTVDPTDPNDVALYDPAVDDVLGYVTAIAVDVVAQEAQFTVQTSYDGCDWAFLQRDTTFCLYELLGNGDNFMNPEEIWVLRYRLSEGHHAHHNTDVQFRFVQRTGMVTSQTLWIGQHLIQPLVVLYP